MAMSQARKPVVCRQILRVEGINARRVDADQSDASVVEMVDEFGASAAKSSLKRSASGKVPVASSTRSSVIVSSKILGPDHAPSRHRDPDDLAGTEIILQRAAVDARGAFANVIVPIGVRPEVNRGVERGQRDVVAPLQVQQDLAPQGRVAGPDGEG